MQLLVMDVSLKDYLIEAGRKRRRLGCFLLGGWAVWLFSVGLFLLGYRAGHYELVFCWIPAHRPLGKARDI